ncbi:MAG: hypothetical protein HZB26_10840 [Candidatus Hydrogenedentes bacterium]|nr:hypothetical protein [Candidatus Hydrogenedentota bacterium]
MFKKFLTVMFGCLLVISGLGCGGGSEPVVQGTVGTPALDPIKEKAAQGKPLTKTEQRKLDSAQDSAAGATK